MKEIDENSFDDNENSIKGKEITNNSIDNYRYIIQNKPTFLIHINKYNFETNININNYSFLKINQMIRAFPEENLVFICNQKILYTPRSSITDSRPSRNSKISSSSSRNHSSSVSSNFLRNNNNNNKKNLKEEIINTDIIDNNQNDNLNIDHLNNNNTKNDRIDDDEIIEHMRNMDQLRYKSEETKILKKENIINIHNSFKKCVIFKWIFHFYLTVGIIIFLHYLTFIFSKYNESYYKWLCIILVISLTYVGYFGIKYQKINFDEKDFFFLGINLFWTNFIIFILTIFTMACLFYGGGQFLFIKSQGILGYFIVLIYLITIVVQAIYVIYYDVIIEVISSEEINNNNINKYNKNDINIQLVDVN